MNKNAFIKKDCTNPQPKMSAQMSWSYTLNVWYDIFRNDNIYFIKTVRCRENNTFVCLHNIYICSISRTTGDTSCIDAFTYTHIMWCILTRLVPCVYIYIGNLLGVVLNHDMGDKDKWSSRLWAPVVCVYVGVW